MSDKAARVIEEAFYRWVGGSRRVTESPGDYILAALKAAGIALVDGFTEEWAVYTERNTLGNLVNTQMQASSREDAQEIAQNLVVKFWRRHEGVAGAGMVKPVPEVRTRLVGPWREVSSHE